MKPSDVNLKILQLLDNTDRKKNTEKHKTFGPSLSVSAKSEYSAKVNEVVEGYASGLDKMSYSKVKN